MFNCIQPKYNLVSYRIKVKNAPPPIALLLHISVYLSSAGGAGVGAAEPTVRRLPTDSERVALRHLAGHQPACHHDCAGAASRLLPPQVRAFHR